MLEVDVGTDLEPFGHVRTESHRSSECVVVVAFHHTLVLHVAYRHVIVHLLCSAVKSDVVILIQTCAERVVIPIESLVVKEVLEYECFFVKTDTASEDTAGRLVGCV